MGSRPSDDTLLLAVAERDVGASRTLYERHAGWLAIRLARRYEPDPAASVSWRTGTGRYRNVGARVRDSAEHVEPSLEDACLLLRGGSPEHEPTGEVPS